MDNPALAAAMSLKPGAITSIEPPGALPDTADLAAAVGRQLAGLVDGAQVPTLSIVAATYDGKDPVAVAFGSTVLLVIPRDEPATTGGLAAAVAEAVVAATMPRAAADGRCSEPLLVLAEGLARAGTLALATLPPELRPVHGWLEEKDAKTALTAVVNAAFDRETPWPRRRAYLLRLGEPGGAEPALAHAAALLVERFGNARAACRAPLELLIAWQRTEGETLPSLPGALKKALARPLDAGMPKEKERSDREAVAAEAVGRQIVSGPVVTGDSGWPLQRKLLAAAFARARGDASLCDWLVDAALAGNVRTGCREREEGGIVAVRALADSTSEVVWLRPGGEAVALLRWPGWVGWPQVDAGRFDLWFVDASGVWRAPLDGRAAPARVASGSFRVLTVATGGSFAALRWPEGRVVVGRGHEITEVAAGGSGGLAWLAADVLAFVAGGSLRLTAPDGVAREVAPAPCVTSLAASASGLIAARGGGCAAALDRIDPSTGKAAPLTALPEAAAGVVALPGGAAVFGTFGGLWLWQPGSSPTRLASGLCPGPG